jgi:hypothetical protein
MLAKTTGNGVSTKSALMAGMGWRGHAPILRLCVKYMPMTSRFRYFLLKITAFHSAFRPEALWAHGSTSISPIMSYRYFRYWALAAALAGCGQTSSPPKQAPAELPTAPEAAPAPAPKPKAEEAPLQEAFGDLDGDGRDERVAVFNTGNIGDFGLERELRIYRGAPGRWTLWQRLSGGVMPSAHGGAMGDPFQGVAVERGSIVLQHAGGSGGGRWAYTHRFRYQKEAWQLIGATVDSGMPCGDWDHYDYNLSTGQIAFQASLQRCEGDSMDEMELREAQFNIKPYALPELEGFEPGGNEVRVAEEQSFYY